MRPLQQCFAVFPSGQGRDRTGDTGIFSAVLYQLSYLSLSLQAPILTSAAAL